MFFLPPTTSTVKFDPNATLTNWEEDVDVRNFTGVACNKQHHRVAELFLSGCRLIGPFSPFLSALTGLLELFDNHLYGVIAPEFSHLTRLHYFRLDGNNLQGPITESFALLSELWSLSFLVTI
ncbi:hypothetical protein Pint_30361 [Pistacia integerrima]|uniref:Uncharacterized protein n=1 Tax=Pistacia integerrima TaxID=434235 RepID=A0ACC0WZR5_9ROSI|nr:hypothetical protein Pint_30361 [Pistacia integerrima]